MTFLRNLSRLNKLVFLFGISPYLLNRKSKKFECSIYTLIYSVTYFLSLSIAIHYLAYSQHINGLIFKSTLPIVIFLQQVTVMVIFFSVMMDFLLKRRKHAEFLNDLVQLDKHLEKFDQIVDRKNELTSMCTYIVFAVCYYATVSIFTSVIGGKKEPLEYVWDALQFFQSISVTLAAHYIRSFAVSLNNMCIPIFRKITSIGDYLQNINDGSKRYSCELLNCIGAFDKVMNLKTQLSNTFGFQLLLNSAFDFITLTISAFGVMYFQVRINSSLFTLYFIAYNVPLIVKSVLLVEALDTLGNQV